MKILFITPYPHGAAPSQRFRFEQYYVYLKENGIGYDTHSFWSEHAWKILYSKGLFIPKVLRLFQGWLKRLWLFFSLGKYDFVFVHRELDPLGLPLFPWLYARLARKKIIYDFDDAIWIPNASESNRAFMRFKNWNNTRYLCKLAFRVSAGNHFLCAYAKEVNSHVVYNPTTIDTENLHNRIKEQDTADFTIGWTGTHSTIRYLEEILPALRKAREKTPFTLEVICDKEPDFQLPFMRFIPWNKATEIEDLLRFNIGLMPLTEDKWSNGKCGFKALQYMALGIPALVSPVGVNTRIVDEGINGFICHTHEDWLKCISLPAQDRDLLQRLAGATREKIDRHFSVRSNRENFLSLFN